MTKPRKRRCRCGRDQDGRCGACVSEITERTRRMFELTFEVAKLSGEMHDLSRKLGELQVRSKFVEKELNALNRSRPSCDACADEYYDYTIALIVRELFPKTTRCQQVSLMKHYLEEAEARGIGSLPLAEKAWNELQQTEVAGE